MSQVFAFPTEDQKITGPQVTANGAYDLLNSKPRVAIEFVCAECRVPLELKFEGGSAVFSPQVRRANGDAIPGDDQQGSGATSSQLMIPFARAYCTPDEAKQKANAIVSPKEARDEGARRIYFCPVCGGSLNPRVLGAIRAPYFAHARGQGKNCAWRSGDQAGGYISHRKADWLATNLKAGAKRPLTPEVHFDLGQAFLNVRGTPIVLEPCKLQGLRVESDGLRQEPMLAPLVFRRSEFIFGVANPLQSEVKVSDADGEPICTWNLSASPQERRERCRAFLLDAQGVGYPVSDLAENPGDLVLLLECDEHDGQPIPKSQSSNIRDLVALGKPVQVAGAKSWFAVRVPWGQEGLEVVRELGGRPLSIRKLLRVTALSTASYQGSRTLIQPADADRKARFWLRPNLTARLTVDLVPIPYGHSPASEIQLDEAGRTVQMRLEDHEMAGECIVLSRDPLDADKIVGDLRLIVLDEAAWKQETEGFGQGEAKSDWTTRLGVRIEANGSQSIVSCNDCRDILVAFEVSEESPHQPSIRDVSIYGPADFLNNSSFLNTIQLTKQTGMPDQPRVLATAGLKQVDDFQYTISMWAHDEACTSIRVQFGGLGHIQLVRHTVRLGAERTMTRLALLGRLRSQPPSTKRLGKQIVENLIQSTVPQTDQAHGWGSELRHLWRRIQGRIHSPESARLGLEWIEERGELSPQIFHDLTARESCGDTLSNEIQNLWIVWKVQQPVLPEQEHEP